MLDWVKKKKGFVSRHRFDLQSAIELCTSPFVITSNVKGIHLNLFYSCCFIVGANYVLFLFLLAAFKKTTQHVTIQNRASFCLIVKRKMGVSHTSLALDHICFYA